MAHTNRRVDTAILQADQERDAQGLQGRAARHVHDHKDQVNEDVLRFIKTA